MGQFDPCCAFRYSERRVLDILEEYSGPENPGWVADREYKAVVRTAIDQLFEDSEDEDGGLGTAVPIPTEADIAERERKVDVKYTNQNEESVVTLIHWNGGMPNAQLCLFCP